MSKALRKWWVVLGVVVCAAGGAVWDCSAAGGELGGALLASNAMSSSQFDMFAQNNISFYDPDECVSGSRSTGPSTLCGSTATEKYWSALSKYIDDPIKIAGIIGNLKHEGGMNPVGWEGGPTREGGGIYRNGELRLGWDYYYNCHSSRTGVGAFAITSNLCGYLHFVSDSAPEFIKYFQDPVSYSYNWMYHPGCSINGNTQVYGDCLLEKIGDAEYDRLVEFEVEYAMETFNPSRTEAYKKQNFSSPSEAAYWWEKKWEIPQPGSSSYRMASAEKAYAELKNFTCSGASSGSSGVGSEVGDTGGSADATALTSEITLIGDSISVQSEGELMAKFPTSFLNKVGSRHSTSKGACDGDEGGLDVLKKIVNGSGTIKNQHQGQATCETVTLDSSALKENVVWELGTNSIGANRETLESVINLIGNRKLFLVTPYNGKAMSSTDANAELYRQVASEHDNVYIVDWNKAVRDSESTYVTRADGMAVHPTDEGKKLLASLIAEAVSGSKDCTTYEGDYPQYLQCDAKWTSVQYGGGDMCHNGCGPAALAMLVTKATGKDVLPTDVAELTKDCAYDGGCGATTEGRLSNARKVCEKYGCEVKEIANDVNSIRAALKEGWMLHFSGGVASSSDVNHVATTDVATNPFLTTGHFVGIFDIDNDDNVMVADPAGDARSRLPGRFNRKMTLAQATAKRWEDRAIIGIKGTSSGKSSCELAGSYCDAGGGSGSNVSGEFGEWGLTYEQAVQFMKNYGANKNNASKSAVDRTAPGQWFIGGCNNQPSKGLGGSNCVTFSVFFMNKFTDAQSCRGRCGDGGEILNHTGNIDKGSEPQVWAVFSYLPIHTGVVLGYHDGEWIVGHASCCNAGVGEGDGIISGSWAGCSKSAGHAAHASKGSGFVKKSSSWQQAVNLGGGYSFKFGYPKNVDTEAIKKFIETGE